ncbi:MAG: T9SS type A sorting domain-containing protein [Bacteroidales bacterium]|nr:T9SS type A sorting domain-containing protein [Bacteroidales bacterium]
MKKLLLFFGLICMINLTFAQEMVIRQNGNSAVRSGEGQIRWGEANPVVPQDSIRFWTGTGSNRAVVAITWNDAVAGNIGIAWGVQWNGTGVSIRMIMDTIAAYDSRLIVSGNAVVANFTYVDSELGLSLVGPAYMWWYNWKAADGSLYESESATDDILVNGDFVDWLPMNPDDDYSTSIADLMIYASDPNDSAPVEATIAFSDILFWVGEGTNEAVMAVNWADTALAWGYRWDGTATVGDMMDHIAAADPRFSYTASYYLDDINYIDTTAGMTTPLGVTPGNWWNSTNNGFMDMGLGQFLNNGDFEKWADPAAGILVDSIYDDIYQYWSYTYVYPMTIHPATVPDTTGDDPGPGPDPEHGPFCGPVGTEGCNAIAADDNQIVAWATNVVLTRGPQDISNPNSPLASYGNEANVIGPATMNNTGEVASLGDGGSALLTFDRPISNGEGPDFAVFENSFNDTFLELAFVEVSSDGVHFVRFPATSLTPTETQVDSYGSVDATFINNLAGKFKIGYGTPFDLEELRDSANINIDSIVYVRVIDVVGTINTQYATYDAFGHIVNDPWPTGFPSGGYDLTGVGVIHQKTVGIDNHEMPQVFAYPNPCNGTLYIINENAERIELYNTNGQLLEMVNNGETQVNLNMQQYPAGLYLLKVGNGVQKILKK